MSITVNRVLARNQICGCIVCRCKHDTKCFGCGAKSCGSHEWERKVYNMEVAA